MESSGGLGKHTATFLKILRRGVKERHLEDPHKVAFRFIQEQACLRIQAYADQVSSDVKACRGTLRAMGYDDTLDLLTARELF